MAGPMAESLVWRDYWWLSAAMLAFTFSLVLLGFLETKRYCMHPEQLRMMQSKPSVDLHPMKRLLARPLNVPN